MFARKTLLVVGAGASREVNLPTGVELAAQIASLLMYEFEFGQIKRGDPAFLQALRLVCGGQNEVLNEHLKLARQITEGIRLVDSIDNYIDTHRHEPRIATCGKAAIAYSILKAERKSHLYVSTESHPPQMNFSQLDKTWYLPFGRLLVDQVPLPDIEQIFENVTVICFNYDRCIEEFLAYYLASVYAIRVSDARALVQRLTILRPYGRLAPLPGSPGSGKPRSIGFGDLNHLDLRDLIVNIKTYTEQIEDTELVSSIRSAMAEAETVVFLGFAFHSQNLRLIVREKGIGAKRIFASAYGFSKSDAEDIAASLKRRLRSSGQAKIEVRNDLTCAGLLSEFKRSLSA